MKNTVVPAVFLSYCSILVVLIPNIFTYCGTSVLCTENVATLSVVNLSVLPVPPKASLALISYTLGSPVTPKPARLLTSPGLSVKYSSSVPA